MAARSDDMTSTPRLYVIRGAYICAGIYSYVTYIGSDLQCNQIGLQEFLQSAVSVCPLSAAEGVAPRG